jgi:ABC-type sugar transport system substrate-binding protein
MNKRFGLLSLLVLFVVFSLIVFGCGDGAPEAVPDTEIDSEEGVVTEITGEGLTIGILPFHTGCLWFDPFTAGGKWFLDDMGAEVLVQNAQWDTRQYNTILRTWSNDPSIDAVIAAPLGGEEILPGVRELVDSGKVVVFSNNEAGYAPEAKFSVRYDSYLACAGLAERVVELLEEKNGEVKGTIIMGLGDTRNPEHIERALGMTDVFDQYPDIEIRSFDSGMTAETAITRTGDLLRTLPEVDAVISVGMLEFMGMINALHREDMAYPIGHEDHIICAGVDTAPDIINENIEAGIVDFAIDQPVLAYNALAAYYLLQYLHLGEDGLPKPGEIINAGDIPLEVSLPVEGMDMLTPPDSWAPAEVVDMVEELGHIWIKTNYVVVNQSNVGDPLLWSNITMQIRDYGF